MVNDAAETLLDLAISAGGRLFVKGSLKGLLAFRQESLLLRCLGESWQRDPAVGD